MEITSRYSDAPSSEVKSEVISAMSCENEIVDGERKIFNMNITDNLDKCANTYIISVDVRRR